MSVNVTRLDDLDSMPTIWIHYFAKNCIYQSTFYRLRNCASLKTRMLIDFVR